MRLLLLVLLGSTAAFCELISFGVKGGVPLTDALKVADRSTYFSDSGRYTIGPAAELHLPFRISVEADALYKPLKYGLRESPGTDVLPATSTGNSWEFPVLLKYRFSGFLLRPYLGAGFSFHRLSGLKQIATIPGSGGESEAESGAGAVAAAGLELRVPFVRLSSEIRYTRWGSTEFGSALAGLSSHRNQAEILIGIAF